MGEMKKIKKAGFIIGLIGGVLGILGCGVLLISGIMRMCVKEQKIKYKNKLYVKDY